MGPRSRQRTMGVIVVNLSISDWVDVLAPRSRTKNEGSAGNPNAIASRGADIDHGGLFEVGHTRKKVYLSSRLKSE